MRHLCLVFAILLLVACGDEPPPVKAPPPPKTPPPVTVETPPPPPVVEPVDDPISPPPPVLPPVEPDDTQAKMLLVGCRALLLDGDLDGAKEMCGGFNRPWFARRGLEEALVALEADIVRACKARTGYYTSLYIRLLSTWDGERRETVGALRKGYHFKFDHSAGPMLVASPYRTDPAKFVEDVRILGFKGVSIPSRSPFDTENLRAVAAVPWLEYLELNATGRKLAALPEGAVAAIAASPSLHTLDLSRCSVGAADLAVLAGLKTLRHLRLPAKGPMDEEFFAALAGLSNLERLVIRPNSGQLPTAGLRIGELKRLKHLEVPFFSREDLLKLLPECRQLESLRIRAMYGPEPLRILAGFPDLVELEWVRPGVEADMQAVGGLVGLKKLGLVVITLGHKQFPRGLGMAPPPKNFLPLAKLTRLEELKLSVGGFNDMPVPDHGWAGLERLHELRRLTAGGYGILDGFLERIGGLPRLEYLELSLGKLVDGSGLAALSGLKNLRHLEIRGHKGIDVSALPAIASLPELRHLEVHGPLCTEKQLLAIAGPGKLEHLELDFADTLTEASLAHLARWPRRPKTLRLRIPRDNMGIAAAIRALDKPKKVRRPKERPPKEKPPKEDPPKEDPKKDPPEWGVTEF